MKKLVITGLAAGAIIMAVAGPASASAAAGVVYSGSCGTYNCNITLKNGSSSFTLTTVNKNAYVWDCTRYGIPQGVAITTNYINILKNNKATVTVAQYLPGSGYHDYIACW